MRGFVEPAVIGPEGVAAVMLRTGEVDRVGGFHTEAGPDLRSAQIDGFGDIQEFEAIKDMLKATLQIPVTLLERTDQAFELHQWGNR